MHAAKLSFACDGSGSITVSRQRRRGDGATPNDLFQHAILKSGLSNDETVWKTVERLAHHYRVRVIPTTVQLHMDPPEEWIDEFLAVRLSQEITCLGKTVDRIESDLEGMRHRANLWSIGDVEGLKTSSFPDDRVTCFNALFSVPKMRNHFATAERTMSEDWLKAADAAVIENESSFAVLPIQELLKPDGWLAKLRSRGYSVQEPL